MPEIIIPRDISLGADNESSLSPHVFYSKKTLSSVRGQGRLLADALLTHRATANKFMNTSSTSAMFRSNFSFDQGSVSGMNSNNKFIKIKIPSINNMKIEPLENFDEFMLTDEDPNLILKKGPQRGFSKWQNMDGSSSWRECLIMSYDHYKNLFLIQWNNEKRTRKEVKENLWRDFTNFLYQ
jgi:hypothetical protein